MATRKTAPGSNLPAEDDEQAAESVEDQIRVITEEETEPLRVLAVYLAQISASNEPIGPLVRRAIDLMPSDRKAAEDYTKALLRMRGIVESVTNEVQAALHWKFGT